MSGTVSTRFFWPDWMSATDLRACGYAARGLWLDMLCVAGSNKGREHGFVMLNGRPLDAADIAKVTGGSVQEVEALLAELERNGVFSRDRRGAIYCRRMIRAEKNRGNGRLGGNPNYKKTKENPKSVKPRPKALIPEPEPEPESLFPNGKSPAGRDKGRTTLPADWQPTVADLEYAAEHGFDRSAAHQLAGAFADFHRSRGSRMADWSAAWRTWVRNEIKFSPRGGGGPKRGGSGFAKVARRLMEEEQ